MKKLHSSRGETLIEVLASILIASLSVALLFGCVMASTSMDRDAEELDGKHYGALTAAETRSGIGTPGKVTVGSTDVTVDIEIYGDAGMYSYKRAIP